MNQKQTQAFYKTLAAALTEKDFLRKAGLKKKTILALLGKRRWLEGAGGRFAGGGFLRGCFGALQGGDAL